MRFMDIVQREPDSPRKAEVLKHMDTLADQVLKASGAA